MNMISELRQRIRKYGTATITAEDYDQLQAEWITRAGISTPSAESAPLTNAPRSITEPIFKPEPWKDEGYNTRPTTPPSESDRDGGCSYASTLLRNLLARIHRDGGHYTAEHGIDKSTEDAEAKVVAWLQPATIPEARVIEECIKLCELVLETVVVPAPTYRKSLWGRISNQDEIDYAQFRREPLKTAIAQLKGKLAREATGGKHE